LSLIPLFVSHPSLPRFIVRAAFSVDSKYSEIKFHSRITEIFRNKSLIPK
jgi:hypothetical protein